MVLRWCITRNFETVYRIAMAGREMGRVWENAVPLANDESRTNMQRHD